MGRTLDLLLASDATALLRDGLALGIICAEIVALFCLPGFP